ncbi:MAG TPA: type II CAAX endopeptidase family protein, partial [Planctomycetota bacterium]|nr:type II CAAX endopeptidase family protein [Planctomycetota bacterium]
AGGYRRVLLDVADRNVQATRLFAKKGFAPTGATGSLPAPREHILEHQLGLELKADAEASPTEEIPSGPSGPPAGNPPLTPQAKRALAVEVLIVLSVGWFASYYYSAAEYVWPEEMSQPWPFWYTYLGWLVRDVPLIALVILMARRGGDSWADLGLLKPRPFWDLFTVGVCFLAEAMARFGYWIYLLPVIERFLPEDDATRWLKYFPAPQGVLQQAFVVLPILVSAFSEEILMRAYLLPRLERLLRSSGEAVFLGALLFALGHVYQGFEGAFLAGLFGLVYGVIFLVTRRLWPLALAHAANNLYVFFTNWP